MKPRIYRILEEAIETGIVQGYSRAFKHTETPDESCVIDSIRTAVMCELNEWFEFDEEVRE